MKKKYNLALIPKNSCEEIISVAQAFVNLSD